MSKRLVVAAVLWIVTAAAGTGTVPAVAHYDVRTGGGQCLKNLQDFDQEIARIGFSISEASTVDGERHHREDAATPRQKLRAWWIAAYLFSRDGDEHSCEIVLASMKRSYRDYLRSVQSASADEPQTKSDRRQQLAKAAPLSAKKELLRAQALIGAEIRNSRDEKIANIEDIVVGADGQNIRYIIGGYGSGVGRSEKWVAIRWPDLRATDSGVFVLDADVEALRRAPPIEQRTLAETNDPEWRRLLDRYWNEALNRR
jgi:sporulation protein YlmC with PRC-barrel domain